MTTYESWIKEQAQAIEPEIWRAGQMTGGPRFPIGTRFRTRGKHPRACQVVDIWRTFNAAGELVKIGYVATHEFMGRTVLEREIPETTIAMGEIR